MASDTPFISMDVEQYNKINHFVKFNWLNKLIAYNLMWVFKKPNQASRSPVCNAIGIFITIISALYSLVLTTYYTYSQQLLETSTTELFLIINCLAMTCLYASKCVAIWYYCRVFNFPWLHPSQTIIQLKDDKFMNKCKKRIKKTNSRIIVFLICFLVTCMIHLGSEILAQPPRLIDWFWYSTFVVCFLFPVGISQCCASIIFLQYELSISKLVHILSINDKNVINIDFTAITDDYKRLIYGWRKESKFWNWYFGIKFFGFFCFVWLYVSELINYITSTADVIFCVVGILVWMIPFCELVIASSHLSSMYHEFCNQLLQTQFNMKKEINKQQDIHHILTITQQCNYLYNFSTVNELYFKLFGSQLNLKASIRLFVFFCVAKFISYSIYNI